MVFSPPFLISKPAPSPRSNHATRFVTSRASGPEAPGLIASCTHWDSAGLSAMSALQACQLPLPTGTDPPPPPPAGGGGGGTRPDRNVSTRVQSLMLFGLLPSYVRARQ